MPETQFTVNKARKEIRVERKFLAPRNIVWNAWTQAELLDQWWAPAPWKTETKEMDFREGGYWLYSMNGPEGEKHWSRADYKKISRRENFVAEDYFTDETGAKNQELPGSEWDVYFKDAGSDTLVEITLSFPTGEALDQIIAMGFKEGFTAGLGNLDALLPELMRSKAPKA